MTYCNLAFHIIKRLFRCCMKNTKANKHLTAVMCMHITFYLHLFKYVLFKMKFLLFNFTLVV